VVQIDDDHQPSSHVHAHPSFGQALAARTEGGAPIAVVHAATDLVCSVLEAAATGENVGGAAVQSLLQAGLRFGLDGAFHLGVTAVMQTGPVQTFMDKFASENATVEDALTRIRAFSALLSLSGGAAVNVGLSQAAGAILGHPLSVTGIGLGVVNGLVATGVLTAGAAALYQTNPGFRKQLDVHLESLFGMFKGGAASSSQPQGPPSFEQADAMELGQAGPSGPQAH
jgi:hypothetical protein